MWFHITFSSPEAKSFLPEKTGQLLGMKGAFDDLDLSAGGSTIAVEYNPTYQFYGEAPSKRLQTPSRRFL